MRIRESADYRENMREAGKLRRKYETLVKRADGLMAAGKLEKGRAVLEQALQVAKQLQAVEAEMDAERKAEYARVTR